MCGFEEPSPLCCGGFSVGSAVHGGHGSGWEEGHAQRRDQRVHVGVRPAIVLGELQLRHFGAKDSVVPSGRGAHVEQMKSPGESQ